MSIEPVKHQPENLFQKIETARVGYLPLWRRVIDEWNSTAEDAAWLTYSANYLLNTAGVRWAMDPYSLFTRLKRNEQPDFVHDLAPLQLVVLTHAHADHLDLNVIRALKHLPITWVVPEFMLKWVVDDAGLAKEKIILPVPGQPINFGNLLLTPFEALHFRESHGVPEMGYLVEFGSKRWLFPGDTRSYDSHRIPVFENLDGVVAHLWLGKGCALELNPPLLEAFCQFFTNLTPRQIVITHLEELGRKADDFWTEAHYIQAYRRIKELSPSIQVSSAFCGQKINF